MDLFGFKARKAAREQSDSKRAFRTYRLNRLYQMQSDGLPATLQADWDGHRQIAAHEAELIPEAPE